MTNKTINERIFTELKNRGIDQKVFAKHINEDDGTVSTWKRSNTLIDAANRLSKISDFFEWSLDYLITGKEKSSSSELLPKEEQKILKYFRELSPEKREQLIEVIEEFTETHTRQNQIPCNITQITKIRLPIAEFAAGAGISIPLEIDNKFLTQEFDYDDVSDLADCGIPINGISMEPDYPNGSIVWVQRRQDIRDGDVVIVIINGEPLCKIFNDKIYYSINEEAGFPPKKPNEDDNVVIFGKVVGVYNKT